MPFRSALFLARDGVVIQNPSFRLDSYNVVWIEGVRETILTFNKRGWYVFIVSNLTEVSLGLQTENDINTLHDRLSIYLEDAGARIDKFYTCPFNESAKVERYRKKSYDRMPKPGMLLQAMADFPVNRFMSFMICGDTVEMEAAKAAGVEGFLFRGGNLHEFVEWAYVDCIGGTR